MTYRQLRRALFELKELENREFAAAEMMRRESQTYSPDQEERIARAERYKKFYVDEEFDKEIDFVDLSW